MEKTPIFFKKGNKKTLPECDRNFQCRYYEDCISEAAIKDVLLDCRSCAYQLTTSQEEWNIQYLVLNNFESIQ